MTSIDNDGTRRGYDMVLITAVTAIAPVPVIVCGGARSPQSCYEAVVTGGADAVVAASIFHYADYTIADVKNYLADRGCNMRIV